MPAHSEKRIFTYHTRVTLSRDQDRALADYAALLCRAERTLHGDLQRGKRAELLKSEYLVRFGLTARQFNAVRIQLEGKLKAMGELLPLQIENLKTKIKKAKKTIAKLAKRVPDWAMVHRKKRRLAGLECRLQQREAERKTGRIGLCFGSRKLFHAQFQLAANGLGSHAEWQGRWREKRSKQFFVLGSKDESGGCQGCWARQAEDGSYTLRLRLPNAAGKKHVLIRGIRLEYGQEQWADSLACGRAISYRFLRDQKSWRLFVATEVMQGKTITKKHCGAIGIDVNPDQLALAELDRCGNYIGGQAIACVPYGKTRNQAIAIVSEAVQRVMEVAVGRRKPLVIERLEFSKKKAALENEGKKRSRMLSSFAYNRIGEQLKAAAYRAGVQVIEVHPAYTSTIGAVNYAPRYGISIHLGAAIAVARRGLHLSERPAARVVQVRSRENNQVTLPLPVRIRGRHVWSFWSKVARQMRAAFAAPVRMLPKDLGSTPASLCSQALSLRACALCAT